jgi:hypothetical protein
MATAVEHLTGELDKARREFIRAKARRDAAAADLEMRDGESRRAYDRVNRLESELMRATEVEEL